MAKQKIQVYTEGTNLIERIKKIKGPYHLTTWCYQALEREVEKAEKKARKEV